MDEQTDTTVSMEEAAQILGCSIRTLRRHLPPGTPGRYRRIGTPGGQIRIERDLLKTLMPAPGGER